jgi:hypothetical protein
VEVLRAAGSEQPEREQANCTLHTVVAPRRNFWVQALHTDGKADTRSTSNMTLMLGENERFRAMCIGMFTF